MGQPEPDDVHEVDGFHTKALRNKEGRAVSRVRRQLWRRMVRLSTPQFQEQHVEKPRTSSAPRAARGQEKNKKSKTNSKRKELSQQLAGNKHCQQQAGKNKAKKTYEEDWLRQADSTDPCLERVAAKNRRGTSRGYDSRKPPTQIQVGIMRWPLRWPRWTTEEGLHKLTCGQSSSKRGGPCDGRDVEDQTSIQSRSAQGCLCDTANNTRPAG